MTQCPSCGWKYMEQKTFDEVLSYKNETVILEGLSGERCPKCEDAILDHESYDRWTEAQDALITRARINN